MVNFSVNVDRPYIEIEGDKHYTWAQVAKLFKLLSTTPDDYVHQYKIFEALGLSDLQSADHYLRKIVFNLRKITEPYGLFVLNKKDYGYALTSATPAQQALKRLELEAKLYKRSGIDVLDGQTD